MVTTPSGSDQPLQGMPLVDFLDFRDFEELVQRVNEIEEIFDLTTLCPVLFVPTQNLRKLET